MARRTVRADMTLSCHYGSLLSIAAQPIALDDRREKEARMGQPVVHFEVIGRDGEKLQSYYSELFGWQIDANNPMKYGTVQREGNTNSEGVGIGGGVGTGPEGYDGHVTFYVEVPDVEAALA